MQLRQLKISGFKSFADTTLIEFPGNLSGIVGPNGCGKSNVIDAIRWVLGEGRITELRGSSLMSELIFSGSVNRPASSRASVEMVLDNADGLLGGPWAPYAEISVKRIVTRDGTNEYLINGQTVRRRDVLDIFMGTGLGPKSYAIISQGMISSFIKAKPEELRVYLEEAAGVSKYKERRRETENALTRTRANLEKVSLLQRDKAEQIARLSQEAEVAAKWEELSREQRESELMWHFLQEVDAKNEVDRLAAQIAAKEAAALENRRKADEAAGAVEAFKEVAQQKRLQLDAAKKNTWECAARLERAKADAAHLLARKDTCSRQIASLRERIARRTAEKEVLAQRAEELARKIEESREVLAAGEENLAALEESLGEREALCEESKKRYDEARAKAQETEKAIALTQEKIASYTREKTALEEQIETLNEELAGTAPDEARVEELAQVLEEERAALEENRAQEEECETRRLGQQQLLSEARSRNAALQKEAAALCARIETLTALQERAANEGKLPAWLKQMGLETMSRFFEFLSVDGDWARALEAALSVKARAIGLGDVSRAAGFALMPPPARLVFFGKNAPQMPGTASHDGLKPLADLVHIRADAPDRAALENILGVWLSGIFVAQNVNEAMQLKGKLASGESIVTPQGHIVDAVSLSFWAEETEAASTLSRAMELAALQEQETNSKAERDQAQAAEEKALAAFSVAEGDLARIKSQNAAATSKLHGVETEYARLSAALEAWRSRRARVEEELGKLRSRSEELAALSEEAENLFARDDEALSFVQQASLDAQIAFEEAEKAVRQVQDGIARTRQELLLTKNAASVSAERITEAENSARRADEEIADMTEEIEAVRAELEGIDDAAQKAGIAELMAANEQARTLEVQAQQQSDEAENALEAERQKHREFLDSQLPLQQAIADLQVKRQSWITQGAVFTEAVDQSGADRNALSATAYAQKLKAGPVKKKVERLSEEIAALGPVNHAALESLTATQQAMQETERQVNDLTAAIANLETTIRKIDAQTRELLRGTFESVNENFDRMFKSLFGGGRASLTMTGDEILESGVEVTAQPPGKKNDGIRVLSGGEQALTATALVFAMFCLNPAPFCLLDEVDAPLDEANQERLARSIVQMSGKTQFMMITHHRVTMEYLKQLIGVTMKEPGVSRVVAVDIEEAAKISG